MENRPAGRSWRRLRCLGVTVYAAFLVTAPFAHHDLICHLKTPQHCTSCASSEPGSAPHAPELLGAWHLTDAGRAVLPPVVANGIVLAVGSTGRSPPEFS
jgi:hypothetical protein